jgi:hypothetical protein
VVVFGVSSLPVNQAGQRLCPTAGFAECPRQLDVIQTRDPPTEGDG